MSGEAKASAAHHGFSLAASVAGDRDTFPFVLFGSRVNWLPQFGKQPWINTLVHGV
jgi:hypothetical protein